MLFDWKPGPRQVAVMDQKTGEHKQSKSGEFLFEELPPKFEGVIKFKVPTYSERLSYIRDTNMSVSNDGVDQLNNFDRLIKMVDIAKKHIKEVSVKRLDDDYEFKSVEMLECDNQGAELLSEVAQKVIAGVTLGKK